MTQKEFEKKLLKKLRGVDAEERERTLEYYREMIQDRMDDGMIEADAIAAVGPVESIVGVLSPAKKTHSVGTILLIVLGSPLWLSLAFALFACVLAVDVSLWAVVIALFACVLAFALGVPGGFATAVLFFARGFAPTGLSFVGAAFACAGLACLFWAISVLSGKGLVRLNVTLWKRLTRKGGAKA